MTFYGDLAVQWWAKVIFFMHSIMHPRYEGFPGEHLLQDIM